MTGLWACGGQGVECNGLNEKSERVEHLVLGWCLCVGRPWVFAYIALHLPFFRQSLSLSFALTVSDKLTH